MATEQSLEERLALYCGTWKFVSCDNFDNYLKELGINVVLRKLAAIASPNVIISVYEDWITMRYDGRPETWVHRNRGHRNDPRAGSS